MGLSRLWDWLLMTWRLTGWQERIIIFVAVAVIILSIIG